MSFLARSPFGGGLLRAWYDIMKQSSQVGITYTGLVTLTVAGRRGRRGSGNLMRFWWVGGITEFYLSPGN